MSVHVIIGEDDYLVGETAKKIIGEGIGLEVIDSANASNAEAQLTDLRRADESFATPPFLEPSKVTWWKNVHFLPGGKGKVAEEVKTALEGFAARLGAAKLPDNQAFILSGPHLLKTSIVAKKLSSVEIVTFAAEKPWEAARNAVGRAVEFASDNGLRFESGVAEKFVAIVGTDARSLMSEVTKLRDFLGAARQTITAQDVATITSPGAQAEPLAWDVTDAIGARDIPKALAALRKFELESGFEVFMSSMIEKFFRQLLAVKEGRAGEMNPYVARKNAGFAAKWTLRELQVARARFFALREKVVSGLTCGDILIVTELVRVMRKA